MKLIYAPITLLWLREWIYTGDSKFYRDINPGIPESGLYRGGKNDMCTHIPTQYYPQTIVVDAQRSFEEIKLNISYPLIAKPDDGCRGIDVQKIYDEDTLKEYHNKAQNTYLIQEFLTHKNECAIFYIRYPDQEKGIISGITGKEFMKVIGNGKSTLTQLMEKDPRHSLQINRLKKKMNLETIPPLGQELILEEIGNHNRGTKFYDASKHITQKLTDVIDQIAKNIPGFYYGRFDVKFQDWDSLEAGNSFAIIELNGALSEPTHMYDPKYSYWQGIKILAQHHKHMFRIARINRQKKLNNS
jgi:hypothetical protein